MSVEDFEKDGLIYRKMIESDIPKVLAFVDIFLRRSWFVRRKYCFDHMNESWVVLDADKLVGWIFIGGKKVKKTLYNLIVHPKYRGRHIGGILIEKLKPKIIRSKTDQTTGDPTEFYKKIGYEVTEMKQGRKKKINIMRKSEPKSESQGDGDNDEE
jgi:N-acetylglutamate synthase-like GNAT family acetyltransferase